jgi:hypothetical protein
MLKTVIDRFLPKWQDLGGHDVHHASPMMQTIMELREKYDLHMTVERYVSDNSMPDGRSHGNRGYYAAWDFSF